MSQIAGIQDFRQQGPPADIGTFVTPGTTMVFHYTFAGTTYVCCVRSGERGWILVDYGVLATPVIQSAIALGGKIYFSAETFTINATILCTTSAELIGCGVAQTLLIMAAAVNVNMFEYTGILDIGWFVWRDMNLDGVGNAAGDGIHIAPTGAGRFIDASMYNVYIHRFAGRGIYTEEGWGWELNKVIIESCGASGLEIRGPRLKVFGGKFSSNTLNGIFVLANGTTIIGAEIDNNYQNGVNILYLYENLIAFCYIHNNSLEAANTYDGVKLDGPTYGNSIVLNIIDGNNQQRYGVNIDAYGNVNTRVLGNRFTNNVTAHIYDGGTNTMLATKVIPFLMGGSVEGTVDVNKFISATASAKGWQVNTSATDWAVALGQLPSELQQIVRIKVWAVALGAPLGAGGQMHVQLIVNAGADNAAFNTESVDLANFDSITTDYVAGDVVYWSASASDDVDIGHMLGGMSIEVKVIYQAGANPDGATNAVFRVVEIEYV
jgi:hypothetical protein